MLKAILIYLIVLIMYISITYLCAAFITTEINFIKWNSASRVTLVFLWFIYFVFSPILISFIKDDL